MVPRRLERPVNCAREPGGWGRTLTCMVHAQSHQVIGTSRSTLWDFCARFMIQEVISMIELLLRLFAPVADVIGFSTDQKINP